MITIMTAVFILLAPDCLTCELYRFLYFILLISGLMFLLTIIKLLVKYRTKLLSCLTVAYTVRRIFLFALSFWIFKGF